MGNRVVVVWFHRQVALLWVVGVGVVGGRIVVIPPTGNDQGLEKAKEKRIAVMW